MAGPAAFAKAINKFSRKAAKCKKKKLPLQSVRSIVKWHNIKQQYCFIASRAVDIIRIVYYINGPWGDENKNSSADEIGERYRLNNVVVLKIYLPYTQFPRNVRLSSANRDIFRLIVTSFIIAPYKYSYLLWSLSVVRHCTYSSILLHFRVSWRWIISWPWHLG